MGSDTGQDSRQGNRLARGNAGLAGRVMECLTAAVMTAMCVIVPLYAKDGYHQIGKAKFAAYRTVMATGFALLFAALVPYIVVMARERKERRKLRVSVTDGFAIAYLALTVVSAVSGGFYEDAVWGYDGWNMGLMSQLSFILIYFCVSRFGKYYRAMLAALCTTACAVYVIGILHRLLIDPIGFYDGLAYFQKALFLSTLGQASWYGSFLAVTLPVSMGVFLYADGNVRGGQLGTWYGDHAFPYTRGNVWGDQLRTRQGVHVFLNTPGNVRRILSGVCMTIGFCTLVTQNSDSAYFALAGALLLFFMASAQERETMCRFMGMLTLLFASGKLMCFLMGINPNPELEVDYVTRIMWTSAFTWLLLVFCLALTVALYIMGKRGVGYPTGLMKKACRMAPIAAVAVIAGAILVICLQARGALPKPVGDRLAEVSYLNWNAEWGNGRGRIWRFGAKLFAEAGPLHKLFGVGPDCFSSYVNAYYGEEEALLWGDKRLTNAHNEWMNILINGGMLGVAAYAGIYVTAICRFFRERRREILLTGIAAACVAYMCYNFFCYQQVLCTPFVFLLMGMGEYVVRQAYMEDQ